MLYQSWQPAQKSHSPRLFIRSNGFSYVNSAAYADNLGVACTPSRRSQLEMPFDVVSMREMGKGISGDAALTTVRFRSHVPVSGRERGRRLKGK